MYECYTLLHTFAYKANNIKLEDQGYIEIRVTNKDNSLKPNDVDITDIKTFITNVENFLYPESKDKKNRPHIAYDLQEGSAKHKFFLPITAVILFNGLISEINKRESIDFLDYTRQKCIDKFQKIASKEGYTLEFNNSISETTGLTISNSTNYVLTKPDYIESEFYLYGEIYQEGGKKPNLHVSTKEFGNIIVSTTKEQITQGDKKTYQPYGLKVKGKKNLDDGKIFDLQLVEFIKYKPKFNKDLFNKVLNKASNNWNKISNIDNWLNDIKTEGL